MRHSQGIFADMQHERCLVVALAALCAAPSGLAHDFDSQRFGEHALEQCVKDAMKHEMIPMPAHQAAVYCVCFVDELNREATEQDVESMERGDQVGFRRAFVTATQACLRRVVFRLEGN